MHISDRKLRASARGFGLPGACLRALVALSIFTSSAAASADTETARDEAAVDRALSELNDPNYFYDPLESFKQGARHLLDSKGKWVLVGAVGAVATATLFDKQMQATFREKNRFGFLEPMGNKFFGTSAPGAILGAGLWAYGNIANKSREKSAGQAEIEALIATQVMVSAIKHAVHRERPDKSDSLSFPSGHNSIAWTTAAVLHEFYGWKVGALGYATGVATMVSRMGANKHWFSDTVGGAAAGLIIGGAIARAHKKRLEKIAANQHGKEWEITLQPQIQQNAPGVMITVSY